MPRLAFCLLLLASAAALAAGALAEEGELPKLTRGFDEGKFVDDYYGLVFTAEGLDEGYASGPSAGGVVLWTGKAADGVSLRILAFEHGEAGSSAACRARFLALLEADGKSRSDMEKGEEPHPWVLFVEKSIAGFERHHGYAFFARGHQCFSVHAKVNEKSETSGEAIRKALFGLTVLAKSDSFLGADMFAKSAGADPREPTVLANAGMRYMQTDPPLPVQALATLRLALKTAPEDLFTPQGRWAIAETMGLALLTLDRVEESLPIWKQAVEYAADTDDPAASALNSRYNLSCAYSRLGRLDEAFAELERVLSSGAGASLEQLKGHAQTDPDLEPMRKDPRWTALFAD